MNGAYQLKRYHKLEMMISDLRPRIEPAGSSLEPPNSDVRGQELVDLGDERFLRLTPRRFGDHLQRDPGRT
jgi:hypothetical protein